MSERRPGQSLAEHIAKLDAERANWVRGEHGEKLVAAELDRLTEGQWWVLHSIPRGSAGTDLDHLVIGVGGVYSLNTKNVSSNVWVAERVLMVGGTRTNFAGGRARSARRCSPIAGPHQPTGRRAPDDRLHSGSPRNLDLRPLTDAALAGPHCGR